MFFVLACVKCLVLIGAIMYTLQLITKMVVGLTLAYSRWVNKEVYQLSIDGNIILYPSILWGITYYLVIITPKVIN